MNNIQLSTYVNFQGKAREAMEFYHSVLGGELYLQTQDEQGTPRPAGPGDSIAYSQLDAAGALIIGVDGHPNYPAAVGENMAVALGGTDRERLSEIFNKLAEVGQLKMPLRKQPSGAEVGWLADRFGINWMMSIDKG